MHQLRTVPTVQYAVSTKSTGPPNQPSGRLVRTFQGFDLTGSLGESRHPPDRSVRSDRAVVTVRAGGLYKWASQGIVGMPGVEVRCGARDQEGRQAAVWAWFWIEHRTWIDGPRLFGGHTGTHLIN